MNVHFIAIGGSAMHNLARALHEKGEQVTGSDDAIYEPSCSRLQEKGLLPKEEGWFPDKITTSLDVVILGMHAKPNNPELLRAQELGLTIYSYPEFLYQYSQQKTRVVIGGSHGKTTITAMILHVLHYHQREVDYMVGAQLEGFDTMVHLTAENEFIVLEGDEYLSSPIDRRPKFHWYQPNIALVSGIAWDHINVFPTEENYKEQFRVFMDSIVHGGILVYNEEDVHVKELAEATQIPIRKHEYRSLDYEVIDGQTYLTTSEGPLPVAVFGAHNISNLAGAKWVCQHMGIDEEDFYEAIASFKGASKRLETVYKSSDRVLYKDFAHAPSKVKATTHAVKNQYPNRSLLACLELHTYSSLSSQFINQYKGALSQATQAVVYYDQEALSLKGMKAIEVEDIQKAFNHPFLQVFTNAKDFHQYLFQQQCQNMCLLMMSSGNYGGLDWDQFTAYFKR
jgi:UDP-N-acetylmuramate: L-alanyl-gamma-D-glutamyl-meso-diaminopimelate ligase